MESMPHACWWTQLYAAPGALATARACRTGNAPKTKQAGPRENNTPFSFSAAALKKRAKFIAANRTSDMLN